VISVQLDEIKKTLSDSFHSSLEVFEISCHDKRPLDISARAEKIHRNIDTVQYTYARFNARFLASIIGSICFLQGSVK
jgi:hypothetical protein